MPRSSSPARLRLGPLPGGAPFVLALALLACGGDSGDAPESRVGDAPESTAALEEAPASVEDLQARRARFDATVWADEKLAGQYGHALVTLWDALLEANRRGDLDAKVGILASQEFGSIRIGAPTAVESLELGIESFSFSEDPRELDTTAWAALVQEIADSGYRLVQSEWHHSRFAPPRDGEPARSWIATVLHLYDPARERRAAVEGELAVEWSQQRNEHGDFVPARIDATGLRMLTRSGPAPFEQILTTASPLRDDPYAGLHPVILYDLDRDGLLEIVMVRAPRVLRNRGGGEFLEEPLLEHPYLLTEAAAIGDLDGDGFPDLLATRARGDLVVYRGDAQGRFRGEPEVPVQLPEPLRGPSAISLGDVDADGDLDVWLAQYKPAYLEGQFPTPFYDANDGHPSYLLQNRGDGTLVDVTEASGLGPKRFRRTYAASLIDLDEDTDLDLLVVSDYAGVDLYHNDGSGHFSDANDTLRGDRHLFGMSAALADFDLDGRLDFFVAGMASTTARRLEALGLAREDRPDIAEMRMRMAWGNRLYLASDGGWAEPEYRAQVARTGWTWGTTAFDFDNDGDPDLFAANGHASGESTEDYCGTFWRHDIYDGQSDPDPARESLFQRAGQGVASGKESWDGHQKNQLLMNRSGRGFASVAFLLGVADEFDSRSAVSGDLDLDGRVDLVVTEDLGSAGEKLHVYRNRLETGHAWIGVQLEEQGGGTSPVGASVRLRTSERTHVGRVAVGETLMGQHAPMLHFGLGDAERVESLEVRWVDGRTQLLREPEIRRYHRVRAPERGSGGKP